MELDRDVQVSQLVAGSGKSAERGSDLTPRNAQFGGQGQVFEWLRERIARGEEQPHRYVVTGSWGLGKSIVIRWIARYLALEFLAAEDNTRSPLPIGIPMQQITLEPEHEKKFRGAEERAASPWGVLKEYWCNWAKDLVKGEMKKAGWPEEKLETIPTFHKEWLEERMKLSPTVLLMDGVDDFLFRNEKINLSQHLRLMLRQIEDAHPNNRFLHVVLGVRNAQPNLSDLATEPDRDVFGILPLSEEQAEHLYPGTADVLKKIPDTRMRDWILTPILLNRLGPKISKIPTEKIESRYDLVQAALQVDLDRARFSEPSRILFDALTIIAWPFFQRQKGNMSLQQIAEEAVRLRDAWTNHLRVVGLEDLDLIKGFSVVVNEQQCEALMKGSVFFPIAEKRYRFNHRLWEEFLVARYLSLCITTRNNQELGHRAFYKDIYELAGETLAETEISHLMVEEAVNQTNQFVVGNIGALLGYSAIRIRQESIKSLLSKIETFPDMARHVVLNSLSYRTLRRESRDSSHHVLRKEIISKLHEHADPDGRTKRNSLTASMAWCYLSAFAQKFGTERPAKSWPVLARDEKGLQDVLKMVCTPEQGKYTTDDKQESLQIGFLRMFPAALRDPMLVIGAVHYLFLITAAHRFGGSIGEIDTYLPRLIEDPDIAKIITGFDLVTEVRDIWIQCKQMIDELR